MSTDIDGIKLLIAELDEKIRPLKDRQDRLKQRLRKAESLEFIRANRITKEQVHFSIGDDLPWFGHISELGKWLRENTDKPWCEWNGLIYRTSEIIEGRLARKAVGRYEDLDDAIE